MQNLVFGFCALIRTQFRAIESSGRMISPEKGQGHSFVPKKGQQISPSVTTYAPPPLNTPRVERNYSPCFGFGPPNHFEKSTPLCLSNTDCHETIKRETAAILKISDAKFVLTST